MSSHSEVPVSQVTPLEEAVVLLSRIAWHRKNLAWHNALAEQRAGEIRERIAWNESQLKEIAVTLKQEYGKAETALPNGGTVRVQKARGRFVIIDQRAAEAFAGSVGAMKPRTPVVDVAKLRKMLQEGIAGDLAIPTTGEAVEWAKVEKPADGLSLSYTMPGEKELTAAEQAEADAVDMVPSLTAAIADVTGQGEGVF